MTMYIPPWFIVLVVFLVPPYFLCRFGRRTFNELDASDQLKAYISTALYWSGGLGVFVGPYLFLGWMPLLAALLVGWAIALGLSFLGVSLDRRLTARLRDQDRTGRLP